MPDDMMRLVDLVGIHVDAASGTPLVILREHEAPHRVLPMLIGGSEAASIAVALSGQSPPRPLTHDLMAALLSSLDTRVDAIEVTAMQDGAFLAELALSGPAGRRRLDARPSDCIALAVRMGAPVYASDVVLSEAGTVLAEQPDDETIDRAVAEFRHYLDQLDPAALSTALQEPPAGDQLRAAEPEPRGETDVHDPQPPRTEPDTGDPG